jgi:acyl-CoA dehydrogenase
VLEEPRPGTRDRHRDLRDAIRTLCARYPGAYWRDLDRQRAYPDEFVDALTQGGYLAAPIPEKYGGLGLNLGEASIILEEISRSGGNPATVHAQMYVMGAILRHGSAEQKMRILPRVARGELRLQAFGVTEPTAGSDTLSIGTTAVRDDQGYVITGQKVFTSRVQQSDLMLLLARTTPIAEKAGRSQGLSMFLIDLHRPEADGLSVRPIETMVNHHTNEVFFDQLRVPLDSLVGEEGRGFAYVLDGMNAERILIAAECIGDGRYFLDRATEYARTREVFGRPIGMNQGIQFPLARCYAAVEASDLMRWRACDLFDMEQPCGPEANMAKLLASEASWATGNAAMQTFGGYAFAVEYDIERKFRETCLYQVAPISTNLILAYIGHNILGLPKSY